MGHIVGKEIYKDLGRKIDGMMFSAPQRKIFYDILKQLYSEEEADVVIKMPYALSNLDRIAASTGYDPANLQSILERLTAKGLVIDIFVNNAYHYTPSPIVVAFFKLTPVHRALMSDTLRSSFLKSMELGLNVQGKGWLAKL
jgi:hypothetical protein